MPPPAYFAPTPTGLGISLGHLAADDRWGCVMLRSSDGTRARRWLPLGGGHRALGDTLAREVLLAMTAPTGLPRGQAGPRRR